MKKQERGTGRERKKEKETQPDELHLGGESSEN
jgi:hypothetical protein